MLGESRQRGDEDNGREEVDKVGGRPDEKSARVAESVPHIERVIVVIEEWKENTSYLLSV